MNWNLPLIIGFKKQNPNFFEKEIYELPERWKSCIDKDGDYFEEKLYFFDCINFFFFSKHQFFDHSYFSKNESITDI